MVRLAGHLPTQSAPSCSRDEPAATLPMPQGPDGLPEPRFIELPIGFDLNPAVLSAFASGFVQMTSDQQPFQQGYLPVISLCGQVKRKLAPISVDTGSGLVTEQNYKEISDLVKQGVR